MKLFIGSTLFLLLAGVAGAPAFAGQEPDKDKPKEEPKRQEEPKKAPKPAEKPKQEPARQQQDNKDRAKQEEERKTPPPKPAQHQDNRAQDQQRAKQTEQHSNNNAQQQHRRVPEATFRASFGSEHHFHVERRDDRRFNYGGYWFVYNQPWPGDWDYNDDVYIEDVDGEYYLINPRHSGIRLLVVVND